MSARQRALLVCGAPLAARTPDLVRNLAADGWEPTVIASPTAAEWLDFRALERLTGAAPRSAFRSPGQPKRSPAPDTVVVCPATFNTLNKAAAGVADTYLLAQLCEALGARIPTVAAPMVNHKLWGHPAWQQSLDTLAAVGTRFVDVQNGRC